MELSRAKVHGGDDVCHLRHADDAGGPLVDHAVVDCPGRFIIRIFGSDELSAKLFTQCVECRSIHFACHQFDLETGR
jgi:hypothetical protein